jgi:putative DNA primase/helicase
MVSVSETQKGRALDENTIKALSGDERIKARFLYSEEFEFKPTFKILIYTNHRPRLSADDQALWDRIKLIPFDYRITDEEKIDGFSDILIQEEAEGILAWAVEGCLKWQKEKLKDAEEITKAVNAYRENEDSIGQFLRVVCYVDLNNTSMEIKGSDLLSKFHEWIGNNKMYSRSFYEILQSHGIERHDKRDGIYLRGVALLTEDPTIQLEGAVLSTPETSEEETMRKAGLL